jgi:hypothetical protein
VYNQGDYVSRPSGCIYRVLRDYMTSSTLFHNLRPLSPPHQLDSRRKWAFIHEVQVSTMVNIISIFKPFEYVVSHIALYFMIFLGHYAFFPASPWWLTLCPIKWYFLGGGFDTRNFLEDPSYLSQPYLHFPLLFPPISLSPGILGCIDPRRCFPLFYGKKGIKA